MNETRLHYVDNQNLDPFIYAEQFADPDPAKALAPEELLRRARMIIATELGKDPLLRDHMRQLFKKNAVVSVSPTERGRAKIDEQHVYYVSVLLNIYQTCCSSNRPHSRSSISITNLSRTC